MKKFCELVDMYLAAAPWTHRLMGTKVANINRITVERTRNARAAIALAALVKIDQNSSSGQEKEMVWLLMRALARENPTMGLPLGYECLADDLTEENFSGCYLEVPSDRSARIARMRRAEEGIWVYPAAMPDADAARFLEGMP